MPKCTEEGCPVLQTGKCLNQFEDIISCPHYLSEGSTDIDDSVTTTDRPESEDKNSSNEEDSRFKMHTGLSLLEDEINVISREDYTRLIILAGMPEAGKTTALLSLMHQFETKSDYREYLFAGSRTLVDFEEKAWPSRIDSNNETAKTPRTNDLVPRFLHLALASKKSLDRKENMLFTDVSGELFRTLRDSTPESKKFQLAMRADHFALFFDTHELSEMNLRYVAKNSGLGILKSLIDAAVLTPKTRIQIIFSKWDLFEKKSDKEIHTVFIQELHNEIQQQYGTAYNITFHQIASRPFKSHLLFGHGIGELFDIWISQSQMDFNALKSVQNEEEQDEREFSTYFFTKD